MAKKHDHKHRHDSQSHRMLSDDLRTQLRQWFEHLTRDVSIYLFTDFKFQTDDTVRLGEEARVFLQFINELQDLSERIKFDIYNQDHELAGKWGVDRNPTVVIAPDRYNIRYLGIPLGEESRTFLEMLILVGSGRSRMDDQAAKVVRRIDSPRNVRVFVSPTCPYCPQEAVNGVKAVIENPKQVSLEIVDILFNQDLAEQYSAYSVPQAYANETLIGQGAQSEELFASSLEKLEEQRVFIPDREAGRVETDLVIVGGGPAGLTAGIYAARSGLGAVVVERDKLGGQVATTPVVENYPGVTKISGKSLVDIMVSHAMQYVDIYQGEEVLEVKPGERMEVVTSKRRFTARALLLATGAKYRRLGAPGEDRFAGRGVSYCSTCDGPLFKGKKVIMVGGGNSAVTEALHLLHTGVHVTLVHRRDSLRAQEHLVKQLHDNDVPILWNTEVKEIRGEKKVTGVTLHNNQTGETYNLPTDGVFVAIGYVPSVELAKKIGVELGEDGFIKHEEHRTNVPGVYSAGDVEGGYKQIVTAAGQGAGAAIRIFEDLSNPYWKKGEAAVW
jgi:thioredoxin reductase (NADPH)